MTNAVIIQASSRSNGDTKTIVDQLNKDKNFDIIDLKTKNIGHFDYDFKNSDDDFILLMKELIQKYDTLIFATPVYWYTMSGILKVFFDRLSDLLKTHKDLGRQLRGKNMVLISVNNSSEPVEGFEIPFIKSAEYLCMNFISNTHTWILDNEIPEEVKNKLNLINDQLLASK